MQFVHEDEVAKVGLDIPGWQVAEKLKGNWALYQNIQARKL